MTTPAIPPFLATSRLLMRQFTLDDVDALYRIMNEPDMMRYFPTPTAPERERVERLVARQIDHWRVHGHGWWAVTLPDRGQFIGWCGLQYLPETDEVEVGYLFDRPQWGKGLATEAAKASVAYGFQVHNLPFIVGLTHPDNIASQRVLQKSGLHYTGVAHYFNMTCHRFSMPNPAAPLALSSAGFG
jgi:RimJ/RimL family protein N-acetyltransferase